MRQPSKHDLAATDEAAATMIATMVGPSSSGLRNTLLVLAWLALSALSGWASFGLARDSVLENMQVDGNHRLDLYEASLQRDIDKFAFLPGIVALEPAVHRLLHAPADEGLKTHVNLYLEELSNRAGTLSVYLLNTKGRVLAASNWQRADSFVGEDLSFRPYVQQALREGQGRYFGVGTTRGEPGYYLTTKVGNGASEGIAVVKVGLAQLEHTWSTAESPVFVSDENAVLMLSNVPAWRFMTLVPLDERQRALLKGSQKYNQRSLQPLGWTVLDEAVQGNDSIQLVRLPEMDEATAAYSSGLFLAQSRSLAGTGWRMTVLMPLETARQLALNRAWLAGVLVALGLLLIALLLQRRRHHKEQIQARVALQQAHDVLEKKVQQRTFDLQATNTALQQEVAERVQTEQTLRAAQNELVQAGKLAVIGQLSTEIAHELNQPLAALRTLAGNSQRFLERNQTDMVESNLQRIAELSDRMGRITGQLHSFARKSMEPPKSVLLAQVLDGALTVLEPRIRRSGAVVSCTFAQSDIHAFCDGNRVQQILINLIANALDAMQNVANPKIDIACHCDKELAILTIRDYGPGFSEAALSRLFQPFFTTKPEGQGLGLGLSLSADIAKASGGELQACNHPEGGAMFTLSLPLEDTSQLCG